MPRFKLAMGLIAAAPMVAAGQTYDIAVNSATSTAAWNVSMNAPFTTGGVSHILGNYDAATNPTGTRTLPGLFGSDNGLNNPINITNGGASASANSGATPLHPAGGFRIALDTEANQCVVSGFSADILNGQTVGAAAQISITYSSFRTRQPTCTIIGGFPITVPLGEAQVTAMTALQDGEAPGVLTPAGANQYTFAAPMTVVTTVVATLAGEPMDVPAQTVTVALAGTITLNPNDTATISATLDIDNAQTEPGPIAMDPIAFDEPLCGGHLMVHVTLSEIAFSFGVDGVINASGPLVPPPACDPDINCDGVPDQGDVACMILAVAGDMGCFCQADPDFNLDGVPDQGDVADVILVVAGAPCP